MLVPHGDFTLEEDMTINFESPYFEMGFGGMQLEDTYLIKKDAPSTCRARSPATS